MINLKIEQGSQEWHNARQGIVTATGLARAIGSPKVQQTYMAEIVSERMTEAIGRDLGTAAVRRGREFEPLARKAAALETGLAFEETGILLHDSLPFGASPDAVVYDADTVIGGLEVKVPDSKKHVEYLIAGGLPKEYRDQVLAPFVLSPDIEYWYFASFDDRNYDRPLFIYKATRDTFGADVIEKARMDLSVFLSKVNTAHLNLIF